jgi:uncharacterized membrane protein YdbT with pleckstrin-like domain
MAQRETNEVSEFVLGFFELIGIDILLMTLAVTIPFIGIAQIFYVIPRAIWLHRHQKWSKMKGILVSAVIVLLLNGGCWLWIMNMGW